MIHQLEYIAQCLISLKDYPGFRSFFLPELYLSNMATTYRYLNLNLN